MMFKQALVAVAAFGLSASPMMAQAHQHTPPATKTPAQAPKVQSPTKAPAKTAAPAKAGAMADHAMAGMKGMGMQMDMAEMVCSMGMLPHGGMGQGMGGMGQGMGGGMMGGMQHGQGGMMGGMMGGMKGNAAKADSTMKHEGMAGMKPGAQGAMAGMKHEGMAAGMQHPITPIMLVHHAKDINLTEAQVASFTKLADTSKTACQAHLKQAMGAHEAALPMLGPSQDLAGYEASLKAASSHMIMAHMTVVRAGADAANQLTAAQKQKLHELVMGMSKQPAK